VPAIVIGVQWLLSHYIHRKLRERELFIRFFIDFEQVEYKQIYRDHHHEASEAYKSIKSVRKIIAVFLVMTFIMGVIVLWGFKLKLSSLEIVVIFLYLTISMLMLMALNGFLDVQDILMEGTIISRQAGRKRIAITGVLLLVVSLAALPLTGRESPLPASYLVDAYNWLMEMTKREEKGPTRRAPRVRAPTRRGEQRQMRETLQALEGTEGGIDLKPIMRILGWIALSVLGVLFIAFLVAPLFRRYEGAFHPLKNLQRTLSSLAAGMKRIADSVREMLEGLKATREVDKWKKFQKKAKAPAKSRKKPEQARAKASFRERLVMGKFLRAFFKFTKWGEKKGIKFTTSLGPAEYAYLVKEKVPSTADLCDQVAHIFEEVMYSNHTVDDSRKAEYYTTIKTVTRS
jgi:hypothetical protein